MNGRNDRFWQFGPTAATLLVAYLLVLQGIAVGVGSSARAASAGLFANGVCLTKSEAPGGDPAVPARAGHRFDICCVFHSADLGSAAPPQAPGAVAPPRTFTDLRPATDRSAEVAVVATPPLGARAPPARLA